MQIRKLCSLVIKSPVISLLGTLDVSQRVPQVKWGGSRKGKSQFLTPGPTILVRSPNISSNPWTLISLKLP